MTWNKNISPIEQCLKAELLWTLQMLNIIFSAFILSESSKVVPSY